MGMWERMKAALSRPERRGTGLELSRWAAAPPRRGTAQLLVAYREMPWLRAVVEKIADGVADVRWRVYRLNGEDPLQSKARIMAELRRAPVSRRAGLMKDHRQSGKIIEVDNHAILDLLEDPTDHLSGRTVQKLQQVYLDLVGEAFFVIERVAGFPVGLWPVPPSNVSQLPDYRLPKEQRRYRIAMAGVTREIPAADVLHLRNPDPEDPMGRGIGTAFALGDELDTDEYAARFAKNALFNHMLPTAVIGMESDGGKLSEASLKKWHENIAKEHKGPERAGKVMITSGKVSIARLDANFRDMQFVDLRKFLHAFIRMTYGIPPEVLGDVTSSNRATANAAQAILAEQVIAPRMEFLRGEYQRALVPLFGDDVIIDFDSPVPADREHQLRVMMAQPASFSHDEWRGLAGLKPDPNKQGYPAPLPGSKPNSQNTPAAEEGSPEAEPKQLPADWATAPLT